MLPISDVRLVVVAVIFSALLGWGLGRRSQDRSAVLWAAGLATAAGVAAWLAALGGPADTSPAVAGVSLTVGGAVVTLTVAVGGRR